MQEMLKKNIQSTVLKFSLPAYDQIPDVGLFLDQVCKYVNGYLSPLPEFNLTTSMVSNYVKKGLITSPVKKQYSREQIAYLFFIAVVKTVLSLEDLQLIMKLQQLTYPSQRAYDYFRLELHNILQYVFELKPEPDTIGVDATQEKTILRNAIIAVAHKVYLNQMLAITAERSQQKNGVE